MDKHKTISRNDLASIKSIDKRIKDFNEGKDDGISLKLKGFIGGTNSTIYDEEIQQLFRFVEGELDLADYKIYTNPIGVDEKRVKKVGARLKNHNILKGVTNLYLGEFDRQPKEYVVTSSNEGYEENLNDGIRKTKLDFIKQGLVNQAVMNGQLGEEYYKEQGTIEEAISSYKDDYKQSRLRIGQEAIDYIRSKQFIDESFTEMAFEWIVTGRCFSFKEVRDNDVKYSHVPVDEIIYPIEEAKYLEDRSWCIRRRKVSDAVLIDLFGDKMTVEMFDMITKSHSNAQTSIGSSYGNVIQVGKDGLMVKNEVPSVSTFIDGKCVSGDVTINNPGTTKQGRDLFHYVWKEINKVGILTYLDDFGQEATMEVSADYKLNKDYGDISIEYLLENILMEAYSIDNQSFFDIRVLETDRSDPDNPSIIKLPYNGIIARSKSGNLVSFIKDGLPYQRLINGVHFQMEKLINKNKDKVMVLPYGLIPRKKGMDTTETMYQMDATSILWADETAPNAALAAQMIKVLDMSLGNFINDSIALIKEIKNEYWEVIGMNPQRFSDINQKAGKATTEQAIIRSSVISNDLFRQLDNLIEKDYNGLLDFSKFAWIGGVKGAYARTDASISFFILNEDDAMYHAESHYNVFVKHSAVEAEALDAMRQLALPYLQNNGNIEGAGIMFSTKSVAKMRELLGKVEQNQKEYEQMTGEQEHQRNVELEEMRANLQAKIEELERYKIDKDFEKTILSAEIRADATRAETVRPANDVERMLAEHQINKDNADLNIKQQAEETKKRDSNTKEKEAQTKATIAKQKPKTK